MTSIKVTPPELKEESPEALDRFLLQFERYLRVSKVQENDKLDLFLLCSGGKIASYYDELTWDDLSEDQETAGVTMYTRAVEFAKTKLAGDKNTLAERVKLYSHKQNNVQSINHFVSELRSIAKYCNFPGAFADEAVRDAFCQGLKSDQTKKGVYRAFAINQKAQKKFSLADAISSAEVEESASRTMNLVSHTVDEHQVPVTAALAPDYGDVSAATSAQKRQPPNRRCYWCGSNSMHGRRDCPATGKTCIGCGLVGHFDSVCLKKKGDKVSFVRTPHVSAAAVSHGDRKFVELPTNGKMVSWLVDPGSDISLIDRVLVRSLGIKSYAVTPFNAQAINSSAIPLRAKCDLILSVEGIELRISPYVTSGMTDKALLGVKDLSRFKSVEIIYQGPLPTLRVAAATSIADAFPEVFDQGGLMKIDPFPVIIVTEGALPIRTSTRPRSAADREFIHQEVVSLLRKGVIIESQSPWRSQVLIVTHASGKRRMCVDYAATVNRFTEMDAFPMPDQQDLLSEIHGNSVFSKIDLKDAYHSLSILSEERKYTAFEADGNLYEFTRLPFGVTNGTSAFGRAMKKVLHTLKGTYNFLDDIFVVGKSQDEHDERLRAFFRRAKEFNLSLNSKKCSFNQSTLTFLGHRFEKGQMAPDPDRLEPIQSFPVPENKKELERLLGLLVYYSKWIKNFAIKSLPLFEAKRLGLFPLSSQCIVALQELKQSIAGATLAVPLDNVPLDLETDASGVAIGGVLSQNGQPIAFFSHKLGEVEARWPSVELEAFAIVKAVEKFRHFLVGRPFNLITDQRGVSFLLQGQHASRIKNSKINRWRLELAEYRYNIVYRPGTLNAAADALSRCASVLVDNGESVSELVSVAHKGMGHPGVQRLYQFLTARLGDTTNLRKCVEETIGNCDTCAQLKPRFPRVRNNTLIQSSKPWCRLSIDFVGPKVISNGGNRYLFTVVDEYSRYPFAFAIPQATTEHAVACLSSLFTLFGSPSYVHSDRGAQFECKPFLNFLHAWNVEKSRTTPYHPEGNGQIERFNGIIWKTVLLRLAESESSETCWDEELPLALANVRALPSRALGFRSPHDAFLGFRRRSTIDEKTPLSSKSLSQKVSLPPWLCEGRFAYLKNHRRQRKSDPLVHKIKIIRVLSPYHAEVLFPESGRQSTVSTRHLSRAPKDDECIPEVELGKLPKAATESHQEQQQFYDVEPEPVDDAVVAQDVTNEVNEQVAINDEDGEAEPLAPEGRPQRARRPITEWMFGDWDYEP